MHRLRHPYFVITAAVLIALVITYRNVPRPIKAEREADARQAEARYTPMKWMVPAWMWRGLRVDIGVAALLVSLTPLATRRLSTARAPDTRPRAAKMRGLEWMGMTAAVSIFVSAGVPRLGHSLWGDEEYAAGKFVADRVEMSPEGKAIVTPVPWTDTLWNYWRPTNHVGFTVIARLCHDAFFSRPTGPRDPFMSESLIRLPVLLAGIASILVLVWTCRVWGWGSMAVPVALAYAGHAWLVRFGVDARGYGFVVLLVLLLSGILGRALQTAHWRWWIGFGIAQFYLLWTYPGAIHVPVMMNAAAAWMLWTGEHRDDRIPTFTRWFVANLITVFLVVGIMAPLLVPFLAFLKINRLAGDLDFAWFQDAAAYSVCGAPWLPWSSSNPLCTSLRDNGLPALIDLSILCVAWAVALYGAWSIWQDKARRGLLWFLIGGPLLLLAHLIASHTRPYHWYLIPFLPALLMLWAAAAERLWSQKQRLAILTMIVLVAGIHAMAWPQSRLLVHYPIEANRESVALTREVTNPRHPDYNSKEITACCVMTAGSYDPGAVTFQTVEELHKLMARADHEHRQLTVNFGFRDFYKTEKPDILAMLDNHELFEPVETFPGLFFSTTREVVRYRGKEAP